MKILKFNLKTIGQILFVIIFLSTTPAKSLDKFNEAERVSDYFSGVLLLNDNQYEQSLEFLQRLNGLENSHINFSVKYLYSLVNSENIRQAFKVSAFLPAVYCLGDVSSANKTISRCVWTQSS